MRLAVLLFLAVSAFAQRLEPNVVYGMHSGLALLLDVHHPATPNGYGVVYVSGSGWHSPETYDAEALKGNGQSRMYAQRLAAGGYTVFSINHRAAPRFRYPAAVEDVQRAVRFVKHNAKQWNIRPDRIGAVGGSSGGHLVLMLATADGLGNGASADPVERQSARVQTVVARAAPSDLAAMEVGPVVSFLGQPVTPFSTGLYKQASPLSHVSADDPPVLLIHGDKDETVPYSQSEKMLAALTTAGVAARLLRVPGGRHGPDFPGAVNPPDYMAEMVSWLDRHLPPAAVSGARGGALIDNEYCRVVLASNVPGQKSRRHKHDVNRVMIHLLPGQMRLAFEDGVVNDVTFRAGNVRWDPAGGYHTSENIGGTHYRIVEVEIKKAGGKVVFPAKDPPAADPKHYTVELDTPQVRIVRARYGPGDVAPAHRHELPRVIVALTDQAVKLTQPDGSVSEVRNPAGTVSFTTAAAEHAETNLLNQVFEAVIVEFKTP